MRMLETQPGFARGLRQRGHSPMVFELAAIKSTLE